MKKKERKMKNWIHTQNPLRFPRFTVVVCNFFRKILDEFHDFVSECLFPEEINNPFWVGNRFSVACACDVDIYTRIRHSQQQQQQ